MPFTRLKELRINEETSNAGTKWTIDEDNKLVKEITEITEITEKTYEEIALEHKRTVLGIKSRVISHIIYPKYKDTIENDIDIENISIIYKIDKDVIIKYLNKIDKEVIIKYLNKIDKEVIIESVKDNNISNKQILDYLYNLDNKMNDINVKLDKLLNC